MNAVPMNGDRLVMAPGEMRRVGYATVDALVELLADQRDRPVLGRAAPEQMQQRLGGPPPEEPEGFDRALRYLVDDVLLPQQPSAPRVLRLHSG